jgi:hypothetical protein
LIDRTIITALTKNWVIPELKSKPLTKERHPMTKRETEWQLGDMPDFDPIEMKRRIQAEILRETEGMTGAEYLAHLRKSSEEMRREREQHWAERAKLAGAANKQ